MQNDSDELDRMTRVETRMGRVIPEKERISRPSAADIDEPASATYAELAAGYAKHGTWLPLPDGVKTTTYRPSSDTPATPPEGREQEWAILTGTDASLRSIRTWPWLGEVFGLSDGAYLLTRLWPCSFAVLAGDLWFEKSSAKRWGSTPPRVFPADELSGLRVKQLARYDDIVVHLGNSAVAVAPPKPQPNAVRPWKTVHL